MKVKAGEVISAMEAAAEMRGDKMPLRAASWLILLSKRLEPTYQLLIEKRNDIIKKHCAEGQNQVAKECIPQYFEEVKPFLLEEVEVDAPKVASAIFESVPISPSSLASFEPFLEG